MDKYSSTSIEMAQHRQETVSEHLCELTGVQKRLIRQIWLILKGGPFLLLRLLRLSIVVQRLHDVGRNQPILLLN